MNKYTQMKIVKNDFIDSQRAKREQFIIKVLKENALFDKVKEYCESLIKEEEPFMISMAKKLDVCPCELCNNSSKEYTGSTYFSCDEDMEIKDDECWFDCPKFQLNF